MEHLCGICGEVMQPWHPGSEGYGNNPAPIALADPEARACDWCNSNIVVPLRLHLVGKRKQEVSGG